jgi:hypothetical protein
MRNVLICRLTKGPGNMQEKAVETMSDLLGGCDSAGLDEDMR